MCQITEEFVLASPSLDLVPEPELYASSLLTVTMNSFVLAVKGQKMYNLFTQSEPIWVRPSNSESLNGTWNNGERNTQEEKGTHCTYLAVSSAND